MPSGKLVENCGSCPECGGKGARFPQRDVGDHIKAYRCDTGHIFRIDVKENEILSVYIPFIPLKSCPKCGRTKLERVHDQLYPEQDGVYRLVIYRCPAGHETKERQLEVREFKVPPKELWEGWY